MASKYIKKFHITYTLESDPETPLTMIKGLQKWVYEMGSPNEEEMLSRARLELRSKVPYPAIEKVLKIERVES